MTFKTRVHEVADNLRGTAKNLDDFATEEEQQTLAFLEELDELVFLCDTCNWWCDTDEEGPILGVCISCSDENIEETEE